MPHPAPSARKTSRKLTASEATTLRFDRDGLREAGQRAHAEGRLSDEQLDRLEDLCSALGEASAVDSSIELADDDLIEVLAHESVDCEWVAVPFPSGGLVESVRGGPGGVSSVWLADDALESSGEGMAWGDEWDDVEPDSVPPSTPARPRPCPASITGSFVPAQVAVESDEWPEMEASIPPTGPKMFQASGGSSSRLASARGSLRDLDDGAKTLPPPVRGAPAPKMELPQAMPWKGATLLSAQSAQSAQSTNSPASASFSVFAPLHVGTRLRAPLTIETMGSQRPSEPPLTKSSAIGPLLFAAALVLGLIGEVMISELGNAAPPAQATVSKPSSVAVAGNSMYVAPAVSIVSAPMK